MEGFLHFSAAFLFFVVQSGTAYPTGPPASTCLIMFPKHYVEQQTGVPPYRLVFSSATYTPGQSITVRVESTGAARTFKGYQVTAHRMASSGNPEDFIGAFSTSEQSGQSLACLGHPGAMLAHRDGSNKTSVTATWTAPDSNVGDLQFFLTVVEQKLVFWHKIPASLAAASTAGVVAPAQRVPSLSISPTSTSDWTQCGVTKGCWLVPAPGADNCTGDDCQAAVSYRKDGDVFLLEMAVKGQDQYISVGFSRDELMGDDQTILCIANEGHQSVQLGYNPGQYNDRQYTVGLTNVTVGQVDGRSFCSFTRQAALPSYKPDGSTALFDLNHPCYLFLAWGRVYRDTEVISKHTSAPAISAKMVNMAEFTSATSSTQSLAVSSTAFSCLCLFASVVLNRH